MMPSKWTSEMPSEGSFFLRFGPTDVLVITELPSETAKSTTVFVFKSRLP